MPIPNVETELVIERIKNAALTKAFEELAVLFAGRADHKAFRAAIQQVGVAIERTQIHPLAYSAGIKLVSIELDLAKQNAISAAVSSVRNALQRANQRIR